MGTKRNLSFIIVLLFAIVAAAPVYAGERKSVEDENKSTENDFPRFRIGFEKTALRLATYGRRDGGGSSWTSFGGMVSLMPSEYAYPSLSLGYRLSDRIYIGSKVGMQFRREVTEWRGPDDEERVSNKYGNTYLDFSLSPHASYWFGKGAVRPFLTVEGLIGYGMNKSESDSGSNNGWKYSGFSLGAGAGGGVHIFVGEHVSLNVSLLGQYSFQKSKSETSNSYEDEDGSWQTSSYNQSSKTHSLELLGNLGISGWI